MTKQVFNTECGCMNILGPDGLATHSVIGDPAAFYIRLRDRGPFKCNSEWVRGKAATFHQLARVHATRDADGFKALCVRVHGEAAGSSRTGGGDA